MIKNYFKIAWRNITRQKGYSGINIIGLAIGIAACLLILQYVADILCVVTGRAPPFGIQDKQDAEDVARAQAREALGDAP